MIGVVFKLLYFFDRVSGWRNDEVVDWRQGHTSMFTFANEAIFRDPEKIRNLIGSGTPG